MALSTRAHIKASRGHSLGEQVAVADAHRAEARCLQQLPGSGEVGSRELLITRHLEPAIVRPWEKLRQREPGFAARQDVRHTHFSQPHPPTQPPCGLRLRRPALGAEGVSVA